MYLPYFLKKYPGNHFGAGNLIFLISSGGETVGRF